MLSVNMIAFLFGVAVFLAAYALLAPSRAGEADTIVADVFGEDAVVSAEAGGLFDRYIRPALRNFLPQTPMAARIKARNSSKIVELLVQSGNPWNLQPEEFYGVRLLFSAAGFFVALLGSVIGFLSMLPMPFALLIGTAIGYFVPKVIHDRHRGKRVKEASRGLPEALDLLVITLNSGMNLTPALAEVVERIPDGIIKVELRRVSQDLETGKSLSTALTDFARRCPSPQVESFCGSVLQGERLGSDISSTLSAQSEAAREAYEYMLDEKIGKLPTTLYFPILAFCVPALFIVIMAPAFSSIAKAF